MITNVKKKKWAKTFMVAALSILILFIVGLFGIYFWLSSKWTDFYSEAEMRVRAAEIQQTAPLPDRFYYAYDKIFPQQRTRPLSIMSMQAVVGLLTMQAKKQQNCRQCYCIGSTLHLNKLGLILLSLFIFKHQNIYSRRQIGDLNGFSFHVITRFYITSCSGCYCKISLHNV